MIVVDCESRRTIRFLWIRRRTKYGSPCHAVLAFLAGSSLRSKQPEARLVVACCATWAIARGRGSWRRGPSSRDRYWDTRGGRGPQRVRQGSRGAGGAAASRWRLGPSATSPRARLGRLRDAGDARRADACEDSPHTPCHSAILMRHAQRSLAFGKGMEGHERVREEGKSSP